MESSKFSVCMMNLYIWKYPGQVFDDLWKISAICSINLLVCKTNFVTALSEELMHETK